jgi:hypothetical protein
MMKKIKDLVSENHPVIWCHRPTIYIFILDYKGAKGPKREELHRNHTGYGNTPEIIKQNLPHR